MTALGGSAAYGRASPTVSELKFGSELIHHLPGREQYEGLHAILDTDGSYETREVYSLDAVQKHLTKIHEVIGKAFRATASPHAFKMWSQ